MDTDELDEDETFGFSRNYFLAKETSGSGKKSSYKISDIKPVEEHELKAAVASLPQKHETEVLALLNRYKEDYPKWYFHLRCEFGLLMYGFGSKKLLIENFASSLTNHSVLVINGYLQSINLKQMAATLAELWWEQTGNNKSNFHRSINTRSIDDLLSILNKSSSDETPFLCLIIHNIDGPGLRDFENQQLLAQIASCANVRVVASIDHIHSPLLWDKKMIHCQFKWCWFHVPTYAPYEAESIFYPLILGSGGKEQTARSAAIVLQSLTPNAQGVFRVLAEYLLSHPDESGMPYDDLFSVSRERFMVSSQVTLNSHLTEFKDHELVKVKRNVDGQDCLFVPFSTDALRKVLLEIN